MADRFPAQIWIGGQLSRTAQLFPDDPDDNTTILEGLIAALSEDDASHNYGDIRIPADCPEADLGEYLTDDGKFLNLMSDHAVNGEFPDTEQFCMEHGIAFDRWSDHFCEDAENAHWRPGMDKMVIHDADSNKQEVVDGVTVRLAMEKLDELEAKRLSTLSSYASFTVKTWKIFTDAIRLLHDVCPELPPELEVFNLHD